MGLGASGDGEAELSSLGHAATIDCGLETEGPETTGETSLTVVRVW